MKIYYFTPYFPPDPEAAAVRSYWFHKTLVENGHDVEIISNDQMFFELASSKTNSFVRLFKETLVGLELFFFILFHGPIKKMILSSPPFVTVLLGSWACRLKKIEYILDVRDLYPEVYFDAGLISPDGIIAKVLRRLTRYMYQHAKEIISVTRGLCHSITKYKVPGEKVHLLTNGYDDEIFFAGDKNTKNKKFTVIFHGKIGKVQNVATLLKVAGKLSDVSDIEFLVVGDGSRLEEIKSQNLPNIRLIDTIPYDQIPALLRQCHMGLSFRSDSRIGRDAYPVKVFEYIGSSLPVVVTPVCEMGNLVTEFGLGQTFENDQIDEIADFILKVRSGEWTYSGKMAGLQFSRRETSKKILQII